MRNAPMVGLPQLIDEKFALIGFCRIYLLIRILKDAHTLHPHGPLMQGIEGVTDLEGLRNTNHPSQPPLSSSSLPPLVSHCTYLRAKLLIQAS